MGLNIFTKQATGKTLVATVEKAVGGQVWNNNTLAFEASPSFADASIPISEGAGENLTTYFGVADITGTSPGYLLVRIHDTGDSNKPLGAAVCYFAAGEEMVLANTRLVNGNTQTAGDLSAQVAGVSTNLAVVDANVDTLLTRITANLFSGITHLSKWLGAIAGKTADTGTRAEINATPAGAGYNEITDSLEAQRDLGTGITLTVDQQAAFGYILDQVTVGEIVGDAANTERIFLTDRTGISLVGQVIVFASDAAAANARVPRRVSAHNTTTGLITVDSPFPEVPTDGDTIFFTGYQSTVN